MPLERLIRAEVELFGMERVRLDGPAMEISAAQVQPMALVLHEVIANAAHHGSLSTADGTLSIRWIPAQGWTQIEICETAAPPQATTARPASE